MMRLFVAFWPDPSLVEALPIADLQSAIERQGVRFVRIDRIHLSLRFLGNVLDSDLDELLRALGRELHGASAPYLTLRGVGCFPSQDRPAIVWAGVEGDLDDLRERVARAVDAFAERTEKSFRPHLTLARVSPPSKKVGIALAGAGFSELGPVFGAWTPTEVRLMRTEADGSYSTLATFALSGG